MGGVTLLVVLVLTAACPCRAGDDKRPSYEQLQKMASDLMDRQVVAYHPAYIAVTPGDKADRAKLYTTQFIDNPIQRRNTDEEIIFVVVQSLLELRDQEAAFGANKTLAKGVADRRDVVKAMVAVLHSKAGDDERAKKLDSLQDRYSEIESDAFKKYCGERGYRVDPGSVQTSTITVTLLTNPDGGRICMLSAFEYELCKLRGKNPDAELAKSVLAKSEEIRLAGKYSYQVEWPGGKKSKVGVTTIKEGGKYTLP